MKLCYLITLLAIALAGPAGAVTLNEPTVTKSAAPLDDLAACTVTIVDAIGRTGAQTFPASAPVGGGSHLVVETGFEGLTTFTATCVDLGGNESATASTSKSLPADPPAAPTFQDSP